MKKILVPMADGSEEMELVIIVDMLRRAGANVILAGMSKVCNCSRGVRIESDILLDDIDDNEKYDLIALPGGMGGVNNLRVSNKLKKIIANNVNNSYITAICAAPLILKDFELLSSDTELTSFPEFEEDFSKSKYLNEEVVSYDKFITSRGAGTAIEFSLKLIETLYGKERSQEIAEEIVYNK